MERFKIEELINWKNNASRKPLIIKGARQVGKTWLMLEFAKRHFNNYVYVNFEEDTILQNIFIPDFDIERIKTAISLRTHTDIDDNTLLLFDEIQAAPRGITSLKYFCEKARNIPVIAAGSLLGISMHSHDSFPVGKVDFIELYPMSFHEFLMAIGMEEYLNILKKQEWEKITYIKDQLIQTLKLYYFVGGMPEVVSSYVENKNLEEVRRIQKNIILTYEHDFSKHAPAEQVPRIRIVWENIVGQLAKENKKFIFGVLKKGARAKEFELAIEWLRDAGLVYKVNRVKQGELPLSAYEDLACFKLFLLDVGLLSAMAKIKPETIIKGNELFSTYKGALTEQFVFQQIKDFADFIYYWSAENSIGEIDFLIQHNDIITPVEVKAEENLKARSLRAFVDKHNNMHGIRFSMSDFRIQSWMTNFPLYAITKNIFQAGSNN